MLRPTVMSAGNNQWFYGYRIRRMVASKVLGYLFLVLAQGEKYRRLRYWKSWYVASQVRAIASVFGETQSTGWWTCSRCRIIWLPANLHEVQLR